MAIIQLLLSHKKINVKLKNESDFIFVINVKHQLIYAMMKILKKF